MYTILNWNKRVLFVFALAATFVGASYAQEEPAFVDPANYYEMVRVNIVNIDDEGVGVLRVSLPDCDGCTEDFNFTGNSFLRTPLGNYTGLEKLADWDDREVLVMVGKKDGMVRTVIVD